MIPYPDQLAELSGRTIRTPAWAAVRFKINGEYNTINRKQIISIELNTEVDPLGRTLPTEEATVKIVDFNKTFSPLLPENFATYYSKPFEMSICLGFKDDEGKGVIGPWLNYVVVSMPNYDDNIATFTGSRLLKTLSMAYTHVPIIASLGVVVDSIFAQAGVDGDHYTTVAAAIQKYDTAGINSLPDCTCEDALCTLMSSIGESPRTNYSGVVECSPSITLTSLLVTEKDMLSPVQISILPLVRNVYVSASTHWSSDSSGASQIGQLEGYYSTGQSYTEFIPFSGRLKNENPSVSITNGTLVSSTVYRFGVECTFTVTSETEPVVITVTGTTYGVKNVKYLVPINADGSDDEEISNPWMSMTPARKAASKHGEYLTKNRATYTIDYRGDLRIEPLDVIRVELPYYGAHECLVLSAKLTLDTSYHGELIVKRMDGSYSGFITTAIAGLAVAGQAIAGVELYAVYQGGGVTNE